MVVNKWASWCEPCRREFPLLQRASARFGDRVAFVGVDANDSSAAARTFLEEFPLPYPSYSDPNQDISRIARCHSGLPRDGLLRLERQLVFVKQGQYASEADLVADIRRHAMGG